LIQIIPLHCIIEKKVYFGFAGSLRIIPKRKKAFIGFSSHKSSIKDHRSKLMGIFKGRFFSLPQTVTCVSCYGE
jgi:hypothetical protein